MKKLTLSLALTSTFFFSCENHDSRKKPDDATIKLPSGWHKSGDKPDSYVMGVENQSGANDSKVATIKSRDKYIRGFGTLMQNIQPDTFLGKRIKMTAALKTRDASSAQFWLRVDRAGKTEPLSFDNMDDRPVKGTTDWKEYSIVLDVPEVATNIAFGTMLIGTGEIWFDKFRFDIVDSTVKTTGSINFGQLQRFSAPTNLDFEN
jgi:hypothetical protein